MFDDEKIMNCPITVTIYLHTKTHIYTNIHNINIHSYTIQISGPIREPYYCYDIPTQENAYALTYRT